MVSILLELGRIVADRSTRRWHLVRIAYQIRRVVAAFRLSVGRCATQPWNALGGSPGSVHVRLERAGKRGMVEEPAGKGGHERAGNPSVGSVAKGHPEAGTLPLHAALEDPLCATDDPVGLQEESGANRVC